MIFHDNRLLADDSHEMSYLIFFRKLEKMSQKLSSAAVVVGALRVKTDSMFSYLNSFSPHSNCSSSTRAYASFIISV